MEQAYNNGHVNKHTQQYMQNHRQPHIKQTPTINYNHLLSEDIDLDTMKHYVKDLYLELYTLDEKRRKEEFKKLFETIFLSSKNYEVFIKAILSDLSEETDFFLSMLEDIVTSYAEGSDDGVDISDIFRTGNRIEEGYFVASLKDARKRLLEQNTSGELEERDIHRLRAIDAILGTVYSKKKEANRESVEDCYIGFISHKIESLKEELEKTIKNALSMHGDVSMSSYPQYEEGMGGHFDLAAFLTEEISKFTLSMRDEMLEEIRLVRTSIQELKEILGNNSVNTEGTGENQSIFIDLAKSITDLKENRITKDDFEKIKAEIISALPRQGGSSAMITEVLETVKAINSSMQELQTISEKVEALGKTLGDYIKEEKEFIEKYSKKDDEE